MHFKKSGIKEHKNNPISVSNFCVIIPIYKQYPTRNEKKSLKNTKEKFDNYDIKIIAPAKLQLNEYDFLEGDIIYFPQKYFKDTRTYSRLLLKKFFYNKFLEYSYMIIVQPDVWIIQSNIELGLFTEYDYVGAPWYHGIPLYFFQIRGSRFLPDCMRNSRTVYVGNGGFCLRNINACIRLLRKYWIYAKCWKVNEDAFFSLFGILDSSFNIAPIFVAEKFSLETYAKQKMINEKIDLLASMHGKNGIPICLMILISLNRENRD